MKKKKKLLITSVGTATAIGLIKAIKKTNDYYIIGTDINEYGYTAGSLLVDEFVKVPYAVDEKFVSSITSIILENDIDFVVPINDAEILALSVFSEDNKYLIPTKDVIDKIRNKYICNQIVEKKGIVVPQLVDQNFDGKKIVRDCFGVGSKGIRIYEPNEFLSIKDNQFAQEYICGDEYTVDVLCDREGNPSYIIPRKRIEVKSGVATKVYVENNEELIEIVKNILNIFLLPGFSNIQFIHSNIDNKYYFVEINYRFSGCGSASLLVAPEMTHDFLSIAFSNAKSKELNGMVKWNSIVTRYYEELIHICK